MEGASPQSQLTNPNYCPSDFCYVFSRDNQALLSKIDAYVKHSWSGSQNASTAISLDCKASNGDIPIPISKGEVFSKPPSLGLDYTGEFCFFKYYPEHEVIAFGRDIFGRKSLCWTLSSNLDIDNERCCPSDCSIATLRISPFPSPSELISPSKMVENEYGGVGLQSDSGCSRQVRPPPHCWTECHCGTIYLLKLPKNNLNVKVFSISNSPFPGVANHYELVCTFPLNAPHSDASADSENDCSSNQSKSSTITQYRSSPAVLLEILSYYPKEMVIPSPAIIHSCSILGDGLDCLLSEKIDGNTQQQKHQRFDRSKNQSKIASNNNHPIFRYFHSNNIKFIALHTDILSALPSTLVASKEFHRDYTREFIDQFGNALMGLVPVLNSLQQTITRRHQEKWSNEEQHSISTSFSSSDPTPITATIPILFSGGVDSLMVALMALDLLPDLMIAPSECSFGMPSDEKINRTFRILLINVAFGDSPEACAEAPDRRKSIEAYEFLRRRSNRYSSLCTCDDDAQDYPNQKDHYHFSSGRKQQKQGGGSAAVECSLMLVDVNSQELADCRAKYIASAIAPARTVLDDSIGCVLWFASRARGRFHRYRSDTLIFSQEISDENTSQKQHYLEEQIGCDSKQMSDGLEDRTPFALVGSGSDEQLGGYARFFTVYRTKGIDGVANELSMELQRIGMRNLGRDDRVGTSNGKAILAPFLEEGLVQWLNSVPPDVKTGFFSPKGQQQEQLLQPIENKRLLRNALRLLGVPESLAGSPKRAMQFGSRIAKLENHPKERGSDLCDRLLNQNTKLTSYDHTS